MNTLVSLIIPCRNEEKFIAKCLNSIISQDYPKENLEVLVMDGMSDDGTRETIRQYAEKYRFIKLLDNPKKSTPFAMNIGIKNAKGEIIMKIDAHTVYGKDYVSQCVLNLKKYKADNVGGVLTILPTNNTLTAKAIAFSLSNKFGSAGSLIKTGTEKPKWTDAVAFGCFKKELFKKIGLYNTNMTRSQDIELNFRIKKGGGKILLVPNIKCSYYPAGDLKSFFYRNIIDGLWIFYPLKFGIKAFALKHIIPFLFVLSIIGLGVLSFFSSYFLLLLVFDIALYLIFSVYFSIKISIKEKDIRFLFLMPWVFAARHIGYGLGSILGIIWIFVNKKKPASTIK